MQQTATVTKLLPGNKAELTVHRQTACGHDCSNCGGCGEIVTKPIIVIADNSIGADVGDSVVITGSSKQVLGLAAVVYLVPFVLFFALYSGCGIPSDSGGLGLRRIFPWHPCGSGCEQTPEACQTNLYYFQTVNFQGWHLCQPCILCEDTVKCILEVKQQNVRFCPPAPRGTQGT